MTIQLRGNKPEGPGHTLGDFGSLQRASDEAVADTIVGPHVGDRAPAELTCERFRWVSGISAIDGAGLGAAFEVFKHRTRLLGVDGPDYVRVREEAFDWKAATPSRAVRWSKIDGLGNADRRAAKVLTAGQEREVRRLIDERLLEHER